MNTKYLTRDEVAKLLDISTRTVSRRVKKGKIKVIRNSKGDKYPIEQFQDVKKDDKDIQKEYAKALEKELVEMLQKNIQKLEQEKRELNEEKERIRSSYEQQISDLKNNLQIEQFKTMDGKQRKDFIKLQEKKQDLLLLSNSKNNTSQDIPDTKEKKTLLQKMFSRN